MASKGITNLAFSSSNVQLSYTVPQSPAFYSSMLLFFLNVLLYFAQMKFLKYDNIIYSENFGCFSDTFPAG